MEKLITLNAVPLLLHFQNRYLLQYAVHPFLGRSPRRQMTGWLDAKRGPFSFGTAAIFLALSYW